MQRAIGDVPDSSPGACVTPVPHPAGPVLGYARPPHPAASSVPACCCRWPAMPAVPRLHRPAASAGPATRHRPACAVPWGTARTARPARRRRPVACAPGWRPARCPGSSCADDRCCAPARRANAAGAAGGAVQRHRGTAPSASPGVASGLRRWQRWPAGARHRRAATAGGPAPAAWHRWRHAGQTGALHRRRRTAASTPKVGGASSPSGFRPWPGPRQ
ncbi:hypothetical protein G6F50_015253 [Rhizopus delemar]|uniref:Uncharacterized protein n=1 Tax=Rhizopus delemar TaxID=936053 RepID=A0A9P6XZK1_9FUNG|nr:hypothetical protein G6F50_015253 [Rhizopus delemar]